MEPQTAARYRLLDELRGLDLISMMLYHGMWDVVFLFGVAQKWYTGRPGFVWQQSICWVFILLSGFCLPLGHHPFRRGAVVFGAGALVTAVTLLFLPEDVVWFGVPDPAWLVHAPHRRAGPAAAPRPARRGRGRQRPAVLGDLPHDERLLEPAGRASGPAAGPLRQLHHGLSGLHAEELFLHRLFPAAALAVSVLGGVLPPPPRGPGTSRAAAPVGLPAAGLDGPSLAGALSAPSAGHPGGADGGVPAGESGVKLLEKLASVTA